MREIVIKITDDNKRILHGGYSYTIIYQIGDDYFCTNRYFIDNELYHIRFRIVWFIDRNFYSYVCGQSK